jgi:hypothetical protein
MKTLTNSKVVPKAASEFCFGFDSLSLVDFLHCQPLIGCMKNPRKFTSTLHRRLSELFSGLYAASRTIIEQCGRLPEYWKKDFHN